MGGINMRIYVYQICEYSGLLFLILYYAVKSHGNYSE